MALCRAHARSSFFERADITVSARRSPGTPPVSLIALEAVQRLDAIFVIERAIRARNSDERRRIRQAQSLPLVDDLEVWLKE